MAIYVKEERAGLYPELHDYLLFADAAGSLTGPGLTTVNRGVIDCAPGSKAYCLDGTLYILSTADVWTNVAGVKTIF